MDRLKRNPDIVAREIDNTVFLVGIHNDSVFHLNMIGAAIWKLLAEPASEAETVDVLTEAFPDVPADQVRKDVKRLFRDLEQRNFVIRTG